MTIIQITLNPCIRIYHKKFKFVLYEVKIRVFGSNLGPTVQNLTKVPKKFKFFLYEVKISGFGPNLDLI